jgi:UDPglucose 6-dehydrogenase
MIQDVAERQGNIDTDVVTKALAESTQRIMGPSYMKAGMGDGGACHPRDNIALRYMADKLELGYDIFDAIMNAREVQAKNIAVKLCDIARKNELPILLNGIAYKPGVEYIDGSYALLVDHYCNQLGFNPMKVDPKVYGADPGPFRAVVLLAHPEMYVDITEDSIVVDPWREHTSERYEVIHYGNTRELI